MSIHCRSLSFCGLGQELTETVAETWQNVPELSWRQLGLSENRVYSQWNSHLIGIMISKTIGINGSQHFQTHPIVVHQIFFDLPLAQNFWTTYSINRHCSAGFHSTRTWLERSMSFAQSRAILVESRHLAMNVRIWEHLFHGNPFSWGIVHCQVDRKGWSQDWVRKNGLVW